MKMTFIVLSALFAMPDGTLADTNTAVNAVMEELSGLRAENDALRRENQMLRKALAAKNGVLPDAVLPEKAVESRDGFELQPEDTGYWLSVKSKIRHNKRCRNYRKVKGRPCSPGDGKACKMCGG